MRNFVLLFIVLLLSGCAMGQTTSYEGRSNFKPNYKIPPIALAVIDQRPYVVDGTKAPTYTGTLRSIGGVPYNINTASGRPMAEMLQQMLSLTLTEEGYTVDNMTIFPIDTTEDEAAKILAKNRTKTLLLLLREWRSHIYFNPIFIYDLKMVTINSDGKVNASTIKKGEIEFSKNKETKTLAEAISTVFDDLYNDPKIKNALSLELGQQSEQSVLDTNIKDDGTETITPAKGSNESKKVTSQKITTEKPKCTTDQILNMKSTGMTDDQVKAACN